MRNEKLNKATGEHFNLEGHNISDMRIQIIEKIFTRNGFFRKERERMFINKFDTKRKGLNKVKWFANCKLFKKQTFFFLELQSYVIIVV